MKSSKIIAVHLLNDFSGSPLVFRQSLESLKSNYNIHLFTSTPSGAGFLNGIDGIQHTEIYYKWSSNKLITLLIFLYAQWQLFWRIRKCIGSNDIVYINTLLPFGAALGALSKKCKVIYHVHEISIQPVVFKQFLVFIAQQTSNKIIFVSEYVASSFQFKQKHTVVIHNALPEQFTTQAQQMNSLNTGAPFTVLMLCSLKVYKGIYEFIAVAEQLPQIHFQLVLNASSVEVEKFKKMNLIPNNCFLFTAQTNTIPFYKKAHLVMNLSRIDEWIETFGMTILEAMYCGRPVIVPPVGGVTELVNDGVEGFLINSKNTAGLVNCITNIITDFTLYKSLSNNALIKANAFTASTFTQKIRSHFDSLGKVDTAMEIISISRKMSNSNIY